MSTFDAPSDERVLCVMPTFQCTAECTHCGTASSPRDTTWLPVEHMHTAIDQAAAAGYKRVVFTGGEATLAGKNLHQAMRGAALLGLQVRLVTNAYWATNDDIAARRIHDYICAGLSEINLSTGDQHARFVPLKNIFHAARASVAAALDVVIMVETVKNRSITRETIENDLEMKRIRQEFPYPEITVLEGVWSPLSPSVVEQYPDGLVINTQNLSMRKGCDNVLTTTTVQPDGSIRACCGIGMRFIPELKTGNIRETTLSEADRTAADDFLKQWIRLEGPERILAWAATHDPEIVWENMYAHRCQACIRLYKDSRVKKVIMEHGAEKYAEVVYPAS
jgi:hypothetical protein